MYIAQIPVILYNYKNIGHYKCINIHFGDKLLKKNSDNTFLKHLAVVAEKNDSINPALYEKYDVKRGLRYANGTGVLVGLTKIGDVVGYEIQNGKKIPVPGRLLYRGYDVAELVHDAEQHNDFCFEQTVYLDRKSVV